MFASVCVCVYDETDGYLHAPVLEPLCVTPLYMSRRTVSRIAPRRQNRALFDDFSKSSVSAVSSP